MKKKFRVLVILFVSLLLIAQFIFQLVLAKRDSQTTDEGVHLSAGYTYLTRGDFRFNPEHPPLVKMLAAVPLLALDLRQPPDESNWDKAGNFFYDSWREARLFGEELLYGLNDGERVLFASRIPMALLTMVLGLLIFIVSSRLWGISGGVLSLVLYMLEPIILGHGHLVTTDIGLSLGFLLTIYAFWNYLAKPNFRNIWLRYTRELLPKYRFLF